MVYDVNIQYFIYFHKNNLQKINGFAYIKTKSTNIFQKIWFKNYYFDYFFYATKNNFKC